MDTLTGRELEAAVLTKAAILLKDCQDNWNAPDRDSRLDEALKYNQLIWCLFQGELAMPENPLPKKLREDILSLSVFIDRRSLEILAFPVPEKLSFIINVNLNLAAGLRGSPSDE
jgi:flagellar biosynthesis activator protein FlaF